MSADQLTDHQFQLLRLIAEGERSGFELARAFEQETGTEIPFGALYRAMQEMAGSELITVREQRDGRRVRYFAITPQGRQRLDGQTRRQRDGLDEDDSARGTAPS